MKVLGWILFLSLNSVHAQQVIESAPLSVEDDGARKLNVGEKKVAPPVETKEVVKVEPVEVKSEALEDIEKVSKKDAKKLKAADKKIAKETKPADVPVPAEPAPAIVITPAEAAPAVKTNPQDGQLKLEAAGTPPVVIPVKKPDEIIIFDSQKAVNVPQSEKRIDTIAVSVYEYTLKKYLQFSFGYLGSSYEKIDPNLDKGSGLTSIKFVADMTHRFQSGFAIEIINDMSDQKVPESVRSIQYRLFVDYHAPLTRGTKLKMDWVSGLSLSFGDYSIKRRFVSAQGQELSQKLKDGTIIGLIPAAGLRFYLGTYNSIDLMAEYHLYFGNPQKHIGGLALSPRINLVF